MKKLYVPVLFVFLGTSSDASQASPKSIIDKTRVFLTSKKSKLAVGLLCGGTGIGVISLIYYLSHQNNETKITTTIDEEQDNLCAYLIKNNHDKFKFIQLKRKSNKVLKIIFGGVDEQQQEKLSKGVKGWPNYDLYAEVQISFDPKETQLDPRHKALNEQLRNVLNGQEKAGEWIDGVSGVQRYETSLREHKFIIEAVVTDEKICGSTKEEFKNTYLHEILSIWAIDKKKEGYQISLLCSKKTAENEQLLFTVEL